MVSHVPVGDRQVRFVLMQSPPTKYRPMFNPHLYALVAAIRVARPDSVQPSRRDRASRHSSSVALSRLERFATTGLAGEQSGCWRRCPVAVPAATQRRPRMHE